MLGKRMITGGQAHFERTQGQVASGARGRDAERKASRMLITTSGCDCWVEPDESYTQITEDDQFYLSGAGINVDYSTEPISMGFDFEMYGQTFSEFYLNSKARFLSTTTPSIGRQRNFHSRRMRCTRLLDFGQTQTTGCRERSTTKSPRTKCSSILLM